MRNFSYLLSYSFYSILLIVLLFINNKVTSQNVGILSAPNPNSGCELSTSELVTVVVFNFGTSFSGSFDVSYKINGGSPITETITLSPFPATSTYSYTFSVPADLSTAGSYNFQFYTNLIGDINNNNDTLNNILIVSDTLSYGGIISTSQSVCFGNNTGTLNLNSSLGNIQFWQSSVNSGTSWNNITNTSSTQNFNNINQETWYRAVLKNGLCPTDTSSIAVLSIDSTTIGGIISGSTSVCVPPNSGILTLSGERGSILDWEYSSNGGGAWNSLANTTNTFNYVNQSSTYLYRAVIQNGSCTIKYSDTATVTVLNGAIGGTLTPNIQPVCSGNNSGNIILSGHSGNIVTWEESINSGAVWTTISNTTSSQAYSNLTQDTWYRVIISDCNFDTSSIAKITVDTQPVGGNLSANDTVCINSNSGVVTLSGEIGNIIDWESSTNGGASWVSLSNTLNTYFYSNLNSTTSFRAVVGNGSCPIVYSDTTTIFIDNLPVAGTISGPTNVCISGNTGSLNLNGTIGTILNWESSNNGGISWVSLGNTTNTNNFNNLNQNTIFQAIVTNGVCPNDTTQYTVIVDNVSNAGTLFSSDSVCFLSSGINYINGYSGNITGWESSIDNGITWNSISLTTDTINYSNISNQTLYRAFVKNGVCPIDTSNNITLNIYPNNTTISNDTTIDLGNNATITATGGLFYSWTPTSTLSSPNSSTTNASPTISTNYIVSIIDANGCTYSNNVWVNVNSPEIEDSSLIVIADLISANGDGLNDTWNIMGIEYYPNSKVIVFNTSGNIVYESSNYTNDWKGTWNGQQLPDGTYYYLVEIFGETNVRKGFITIVSK